MSQTACNPKLTSYMRFQDKDVLYIYNQLLTDINTARDAYVYTGEVKIINDYDNETRAIDLKNTENDALCNNIVARINDVQGQYGVVLPLYVAAQAWLDVALRGKTGDVVKHIYAIWPGGRGESKGDSFNGTLEQSFLSLSNSEIRNTLGIVASRTTYEFPTKGYGYTPLGDVATPNPTKEAKKYIQILRKQIEDVEAEHGLRGGTNGQKLDALRAELALGYSITGFVVKAKDILDDCTWKTRTWYRAYADVCKDDVFVSTAYQNVFNVLGGVAAVSLSVKPLSTDYTPEQIAWINLYKERRIHTFSLPGYFEQDFIEIFEKHALDTGALKETYDTVQKLTSKYLTSRFIHTESPPSKRDKILEKRTKRRMALHEYAKPVEIDHARARMAINTFIFEFVGLRDIKRQLLELYKSVLSNNNETIPAQIKLVLNFQFLGNAGTGKTSIVEFLSQFLFFTGLRPMPVDFSALVPIRKEELSLLEDFGKSIEIYDYLEKLDKQYAIRLGLPGPNILRTSASQLIAATQDKTTYFNNLVQSFVRRGGGIVFIDEAYDLRPLSNDKGLVVYGTLMTAAEDYRETLTFIIAGYQDRIEQELIVANTGFPSRFTNVFYFEDFSDEDLTTLWKLWLEKSQACQPDSSPPKYTGWEMADERIISIVVNRVSRRRGMKGYANARTLREMYQKVLLTAEEDLKVYQQNLTGVWPREQGENLIISVEHVIGKEPDEKKGALGKQWKKLMELRGLKKVKDSMKELLGVAKFNWQCEQNYQLPKPITLNKLFVGKPGTGKSTVATIYGNILKELRLLSNGRVLERTSSAFVGGYVGQSQTKTRALISAADGKVLLIDEAYVLAESDFGKRALDTIVEMVPNKPGADIAVVMIGYPDEMLRMCNEVNPGLARRFDIENMVEFEDFSDEDLEWILKFHCDKRGVRCPPDVVIAAIDKITKSRPQRTFGNAGTVVNALSDAIKKRTKQPWPGSSELVLQKEDFGITKRASWEEDLEKFQGADIEIIKGRLRMLERTVRESRKLRLKKDDMPQLSNYVFVGNSGTGKTTVARVLSKVLYKIGLLPSEKVIETNADSLGGKFIGEAQDIVQKKMEKALGGVLLIDEAYGFKTNKYGTQAQTKLIAMLEEKKYKGNIVVVLAGYEHDINEMMNGNQGMRSRFATTFRFNDMLPDECADFIANKLKNDFKCEFGGELHSILIECIQKLKKAGHFANFRDCLNVANKIRMYTYSDESSSEASDEETASEQNPVVTENHIKYAVYDIWTTRASPARGVNRYNWLDSDSDSDPDEEEQQASGSDSDSESNEFSEEESSKEEEQSGEFSIGDTVIITRNGKYKGKKGQLVSKTPKGFQVQVAGSSRNSFFKSSSLQKVGSAVDSTDESSEEEVEEEQKVGHRVPGTSSQSSTSSNWR